MTIVTTKEVSTFSPKTLVKCYKQFLNPDLNTSYHRYIMDTYNVPESSFYNVLAGRRHTTRVCEAFRKEILKRLLNSPNAECDIQFSLGDDECTPPSLEEVITTPKQRRKRSRSPKHSPKSKFTFKLSNDSMQNGSWTYSQALTSSPKRKRVRYSQATPSSPMCVDEEGFNSLENDSISSKSGEKLCDPFGELSLITEVIQDSDDEFTLSVEQIKNIKKIAEDFKVERIARILGYQPRQASTIGMDIKSTTRSLRKNRRKGHPIRSPMF